MIYYCLKLKKILIRLASKTAYRMILTFCLVTFTGKLQADSSSEIHLIY